MPKVQIYTTATCAFCKAEKSFLDAHSVQYEDKKVDADMEAQEAMLKESEQLLGAPAMGVPFTVITKDDGSREGILGFDQPRLMAALGL